jgi:hypothetical protein
MLYEVVIENPVSRLLVNVITVSVVLQDHGAHNEVGWLCKSSNALIKARVVPLTMYLRSGRWRCGEGAPASRGRLRRLEKLARRYGLRGSFSVAIVPTKVLLLRKYLVEGGLSKRELLYQSGPEEYNVLGAFVRHTRLLYASCERPSNDSAIHRGQPIFLIATCTLGPSFFTSPTNCSTA